MQALHPLDKIRTWEIWLQSARKMVHWNSAFRAPIHDTFRTNISKENEQSARLCAIFTFLTSLPFIMESGWSLVGGLPLWKSHTVTIPLSPCYLPRSIYTCLVQHCKLRLVLSRTPPASEPLIIKELTQIMPIITIKSLADSEDEDTFLAAHIPAGLKGLAFYSRHFSCYRRTCGFLLCDNNGWHISC